MPPHPACHHPSTPQPPDPPHPSRRRALRTALTLALLLALAAGVALAVRASLQRLETAAVAAPAVYESLDAAGHLRTPVQVSRAVRALKLVTVEIQTTVTAQAREESWRGDVAASVTAPVTLFYGTDLTALTDTTVEYSPLSRAYIVRVPQPRRIATQVHTESATAVDLGWFRFRSVSGEYFLGQARRALADEAQRMILLPADAEAVARATKDQIAALVRAIAGREASVDVVFVPEG